MDEFHYYGDRDRGMAWQIPLLTLPSTTFLLMSATLGDTYRLEQDLAEFTGRAVSVVASDQRPVPLDFSYSTKPIQTTIGELLDGGRAPVYVVNFSQREAAELAQGLTSLNVTTKEEKRAILDALKGFRFDSPYGKDVRRFVTSGIGVHHAGLLPKYRLLVEQLAQQGLLKIVSGTDTLGVGVNVPIRTVLFTKLCKFDGLKTRLLTIRDFKQIAGRAGRKGYDDQGWVVCQAPEHVIENSRLAAKAAQSGRTKYKKKSPPDRGYVPWDEATFERMQTSPPEELQSVFSVDHGLLLSLLQRPVQGRGGGYGALVELIGQSHEHAGAKSHLRKHARSLFKSLYRAGVVNLVPRPGGGKQIEVATELQDDFSLHHTLSLFLLYAVHRLPQELDSWPLDVVTLVESILENPRPVLARQLDKAKGDLIAELKAEGVPYEERMEKLEEVTWPKPNAEGTYALLEEFTITHPWAETEAVRPKSVVREMIERYMTLTDYIKEYRLDRVEGVLLRYVTQVYKTLLQNVPEELVDDELHDIIAFLRASLARIDSSLITEWEAMLEGAQSSDEPILAHNPQALDLRTEPKARLARVRAELHALVKALAARDWEEAVRSVHAESGWDESAFEEAMAPFFERYERLRFDHHARLADKTSLHAAGPDLWDLTQVLCDPEGDDEFHLQATLDLSDPGSVGPDPIIRPVRIGR